MKITHVIVGLNVGGAELMLQRLIASHAGSQEFEHSVISMTDAGIIGQQLDSQGVKVVCLNLRGVSGLLRAFLQLRQELRSAKPDIVQTWMYHADLLGGLAARSVGIKRVVWGVRTTEIKDGGKSITLIIRKICAIVSYRIPVKIVCVASAARDIHECIGYDPGKMLVIPNGFQIDRLVATSEQAVSIRRHAGFTPEQCVIGSVGRFNAVKDQRNFIQAAGLLAKRYSNVRFIMVGRDLDSNNVQLLKWIAATGYSDRFALMGERSDVPSCLAAIDIFCLHSRTEGFPNAVGEAMAMAKPCVVTDVGDAAFLVGPIGIVVPKSDSSALASGLEKLLLLTSSERRMLGLEARARILAHFTMAHSRLKFEQLYQSVIEDGSD